MHVRLRLPPQPAARPDRQRAQGRPGGGPLPQRRRPAHPRRPDARAAARLARGRPHPDRQGGGHPEGRPPATPRLLQEVVPPRRHHAADRRRRGPGHGAGRRARAVRRVEAHPQSARQRRPRHQALRQRARRRLHRPRGHRDGGRLRLRAPLRGDADGRRLPPRPGRRARRVDGQPPLHADGAEGHRALPAGRRGQESVPERLHLHRGVRQRRPREVAAHDDGPADRAEAGAPVRLPSG